MTSKLRVNTAMKMKPPDRVPVMCQIAIGHYFLHSGVNPTDIWYSAEGFAEALVNLQRRYDFDCILVNLPGRDPKYDKQILGKDRLPAGWFHFEF